jgi:hypothetical protein
MQAKTKAEKIQKQYNDVSAGFIRQGTSLYKFCKKYGIPKATAFRALKEISKCEDAKKLKKYLIEKSKGKVTS